MSYQPVFTVNSSVPKDAVEKVAAVIKELEFLVSGMATRSPSGENRNNLNTVALALAKIDKHCEATLNGINVNDISPKGP